MKKSNRYFLPIVLIIIGVAIGVVGAYFKIQKSENTSVILLISVVVEFSGIALLIIRRLKK